MILLLCGGSTFIVLREEIKENGLALESFKRFELYAAKNLLGSKDYPFSKAEQNFNLQKDSMTL